MSAGESSRSYRNSYEKHRDQLSNLIQQASDELNQFQKWGAKEDDAADIARDLSSHIRDTAETVNRNMHSAVQNRKAMEALNFPLDELGYPSDNESAEDESNSVTGDETIVNREIGASESISMAERIKIEDDRPSASLSWKGKEKEVNPPEDLTDTEFAEEPDVPYSFLFTMSAGDPSRTKLDDFELDETVILNHSTNLIEKLFKFHATWGSEEIGKYFLNKITCKMQRTAEEIQKRTGRIPSVGSSLTLGRDHDTISNRNTHTSESRDMPFQNKGKVTSFEADSSERKAPPCKIVIPGRRLIQLPPKEMRKSKRLLDSLQFDSDVGDELEGEVKQEEAAYRIESVQTGPPGGRSTRYNLRSASRKNTVVNPPRAKDEPGQSEQKRSGRKERKSRTEPKSNKRAGKKRQFEEDEDGNHGEGSSRKSKKRCREDEAEKKKIKKESSDKAVRLNKKRKRGDENTNEEAKSWKKIKRI